MNLSRPALAILIAVNFLLGSSCTDSPDVSDSGPAGSDVPIFRVATLTWVGYAPIDLAKEKGFFEGLDVRLERIEDTAARRAALASGRVDASVDIIDSFVNAVASGLPAKAVLKLDDSMGGDGIVVREGIDSIEDLRGKKVAYPPGLPSHFFLLSLLDDAGMSIDDIESSPMEADQAGAAFVSGSLDAAVTWEPWLTRAAEMPGGKILTTTREKPGLIVDIFTVRNNYLDSHPQEVESFLRGWFLALDFWRQNPTEAGEIMAHSMGLEAREFEVMAQGVRYADFELNRAFFAQAGEGESPFHKSVAHANAIWSREGLIKQPVDSAAIDGSGILLAMQP